MWSIANNLFGRFLDRSRLKIDARIAFQNDRPPYTFGGKSVLLIVLRNPTGVDIPIDKLVISIRGIPWILNTQLQSEEDQPPCIVHARSRRDFWLDAKEVARTLLGEDLGGQHTFDVTVHLSAGGSNRSAPITIDLVRFDEEIAHDDVVREREIGRQIFEALEANDLLAATPISSQTLANYLKRRFPDRSLARNDQQLLSVIAHISDFELLPYRTIRDIDQVLARTTECRRRLAERYPPRSAMDEVVRAMVFENPEYLPSGFPLRKPEFEEHLYEIQDDCFADNRVTSGVAPI